MRDESRQRAAGQLLELVRSSHYSVRRSAYRSLHLVDSVLHERACSTWAASPEPALRQRAAEACVWLGPAEGSDIDWPAILRPLSWDPEPTVREAAVRAREEWLRITWGSLYAAEVLSLDGGANEGILSRWAYGSALTRVGNDDSLRRLEERLDESGLAPHVRTWLRHIQVETRKQWTETIKTWIGPIAEWTGSLEVTL
jgi:hypothetical protein